MSIEAMKQAIEGLNEAVAFREGGRQKAIDAINALRAAIQQAEAKANGAQQSARAEPVGEPVYMTASAFVDGEPYTWRAVSKSLYDSHPEKWRRILYTHPAPGVPEQDWERKERLQSIADTAAASGLFGLAQKWADNEIHSYQFTHQAAAIVLKAMLAAAQAQKGEA